jgi:hypothetical protein
MGCGAGQKREGPYSIMTLPKLYDPAKFRPAAPAPAQSTSAAIDPVALAQKIIECGQRRRSEESADAYLLPVGSLAYQIVMAAKKARSRT